MAREWYSRPLNQTGGVNWTVVDGTTTGNYNNGVPNTYVKTWMEYFINPHTDADLSANQTRVDVKLYSQVIDGGSSSGMSSATTANNYGYVGYDNANQQYLNTTYNFNNFALNTFASATLTIPHNTDGTKSITLQGAFQTLSGTWAITGGSASTSVSLPTIPKGTEITAVYGTNYGVPTSFYMSRKSSGFRERVTMTSGNTTLIIKTTDTADANFTYKLDRDYTPNTAYPSSSTWTVAIYTYNGATLVETKTYSYTWSIADWDLDAYYPYASYSKQAYNDVVSQLGTDTAVAGYSKINVVASASDAHARYNNATIVSRVVTFQDGRTVSGDNDTNHISNVVNSAGRYNFTYTITDSRGLSKTYTDYYDSVISSSAPTINVAECYRGDSSGNASDSGTYIWAKITTSCDSLNGHNTILTRTGKVGSGSAVTMAENTRVALTTSASSTSAYTVTFTVSDRLRTTTVTRNIASETAYPLVIREAGNGVGIGAYSNSANLLNIGYEVCVNSPNGNWAEGIRINQGANGYTTLMLGGESYSTIGHTDGSWWIGCNPTLSGRMLWITHNGSTEGGTYFYAEGEGDHNAKLRLGASGIIQAGNPFAVTGGEVDAQNYWKKYQSQGNDLLISTSGSLSYVYFSISGGTHKTAVGYYGTTLGSFLSHETVARYLGINDNGLPYFKTSFNGEFFPLLAKGYNFLCGKSTAYRGQTLTVYFLKTFGSAPCLVASYSTTSANTSGDWGSLKVFNVTTTSFSIIIDGSAPDSAEFSWMAYA